MDIVVPSLAADESKGVGYLCTSEEQYAEAITHLLTMPQEKRLEIATRARRSVCIHALVFAAPVPVSNLYACPSG